MKRKHVYLLCQVTGWSLMTGVNIAFATSYSPFSWNPVVVYIWGGISGGITTHVLRGFLLKSGWVELNPLQALPRALGASFACGAAITALVTTAWPFTFGLEALKKSGFAWILPAVLIWSITVLVWVLLYFGVHYFERYERSEVEKLRFEVIAKDAQLRALLAQVNPHFLFNCLNSLRALIGEDPARAQNMVTELSSILRYSLQSGNKDLVPLEDEIAAVNAYLKLEAMRLEERLRISMDLAPESLAVSIPPMLVQTLVENGVKHGVARLAKGGEIRVVARVAGGELKIEVSNSGQLYDSGETTQVGLNNARERLRLAFGESATIALRNLDPQRVVAEVSLPLNGSAA